MATEVEAAHPRTRITELVQARHTVTTERDHARAALVAVRQQLVDRIAEHTRLPEEAHAQQERAETAERSHARSEATADAVTAQLDELRADHAQRTEQVAAARAELAVAHAHITGLRSALDTERATHQQTRQARGR